MVLHSSADGCLEGARASERAREGARQAYSQAVALRVRAVLDDMAAQGVVPSFYTVADRACVARSTLYRRPELKRLVAEAREAALRPVLRAGEADEPREAADALCGLTAGRDGLVALRGELATLRCENAALRRGRDSLVGENAALQRENASLRASLACTTAECERLKARLSAADELPAAEQLRYGVCPLDEAA